MTNEQEFTSYEQVEAYVDSLKFDQKPRASTAEAGRAELGGQLEQVCKYYKIVKPVLQLVLALPLIPEKVKKPIREFMAILDTLCP